MLMLEPIGSPGPTREKGLRIVYDIETRLVDSLAATRAADDGALTPPRHTAPQGGERPAISAPPGRGMVLAFAAGQVDKAEA
ncbi:MAG TPA: hypothetical protein DCR78_00385 [Pseudomonas sp.]|uniref:hypothetical protein n=1 Tax=Stutzerimonas TaxID=2901164 RepID=UPI000C50FEED|nr:MULTISPECIES: hypothetical protein [Stutzerimonas]MBK60119.1 hypothetical protein [Pseudomonas sp.]MBU0810539.1 hypothetical protein [Gammaproteobacteria bacterium]MBK3847544.1 hypothetical protein [Stutzerimonas xanthomarina]MBU1300229.1 hypothetical protein [Gammaproteobacteria bacterium]MBU1458923.1 hypothetical protein [Gammaproteobacteria bacterium]